MHLRAPPGEEGGFTHNSETFPDATRANRPLPEHFHTMGLDQDTRTPSPPPMAHSVVPGLPLLRQGKIRDIYAIGETQLLIVTTDRISAYDVVLPQAIPGKGRVLNQLSLFWSRTLQLPVPDHYLASPTLQQLLPAGSAALAALQGRSAVVQRLRPLPIEAIVRGYLSGSGWREYQETGAVCGIPLPRNLQHSEQLPKPIFTPSTKAAPGEHDRNISQEEVEKLLGKTLADRVCTASLDIYRQAAAYAAQRGLLLADTKFEFGLDEAGELHLIDELLTPDSSRFWAADGYQPGSEQPSFDKQYVRDYLDRCNWDHSPPAPNLPAEVIDATSARYLEADRRLRGAAGRQEHPKDPS